VRGDTQPSTAALNVTGIIVREASVVEPQPAEIIPTDLKKTYAIPREYVWKGEKRRSLMDGSVICSTQI
jgi:hypothetical protein